MGTFELKIEMSEKRRESIASVFSSRRDQIRNFIRKRINNLSHVEDLLQDVFTQLVSTFEDIESMDAWLFTVARNRVNDYYRKKKTESIEDLTFLRGGNEDSEAEGLANLLPDLSDSPDQMLLRETIWEEMHSILDDIPPEQKEAFVLHELENYSIKEIAKKQEVPVNTVLSRKRYAVLALKTGLEEFYEEL